MEYKEAIPILLKILKNKSLKSEEKEAILTAVNLLNSGVFAKERLKKNYK